MNNEELIELWDEHRPFIYKIALQYSGYAEMDDLMQEGYLGLYSALIRTRGRHFLLMRPSGSASGCADTLKTAAVRSGYLPEWLPGSRNTESYNQTIKNSLVTSPLLTRCGH